MRAVGAEEKEQPTFLTHGIDFFESSAPPYDVAVQGQTVLTCQACHYDAGVQSFISHSRAHFGPNGTSAPPDLVESTPSREAALDTLWRPQHPELNVDLIEPQQKSRHPGS
jgi:hypothetical protein